MKLKTIFYILVLLGLLGQENQALAKSPKQSNRQSFRLENESSRTARSGGNKKMWVVWDGKRLVVELKPLRGEGEYRLAKRVLGAKFQGLQTVRKYNKNRRLYRSRSIAFPLKVINGNIRSSALQAIFSQDLSGIEGWRHRVSYSWETTSMIAGLFTKNGIKAGHLVRHNKMPKNGNLLRKGDVIEIPWKWLSPELSLRRVSLKAPLKLKQDASGKLYAHYQMKPGEALYSSVVIRFTGRMLNDEVNQMAKDLLKLNKIADARRIKNRQKIRIPLEWLSEEYLNDPENAEDSGNSANLATKTPKAKSKKNKTAKKTKTPKVAKKQHKTKSKPPKVVKNSRSGLQSNAHKIHVILDSGHGGIDPGAIAGSKKTQDLIHEDEVVYDISIRLTKLLKKQGIVVYPTLADPNQKRPVRYLAHRHDRDERLLVTPRYLTRNPRVGINMRIYLINYIYYKLRRQKVPSENILFISLHGDALHSSLNGAMVYYADYRLRRHSFGPKSRVYRQRKEYVSNFSYKAKNNRYSAKLSRTFGKTVIDEFRKTNLRTHRVSSAVRGYLYRKGKKTLPGVLRYSKVPTSVLIEVANLNNRRDRRNLLKSAIRQRVAQAVTNSISTHFNRPSGMLAQR